MRLFYKKTSIYAETVKVHYKPSLFRLKRLFFGKIYNMVKYEYEWSIWAVHPRGQKRHVCVSVPEECAHVIRNRIVVLSVYTIHKNLGICTV